MAHVTLSIPDEVYKNMKRYPEIKWSEVVRKTIVSYLEGMQDTASSADIRESLSVETLDKLRAIGLNKSKKYYAKMAKEEWKRAKSLTQTS